MSHVSGMQNYMPSDSLAIGIMLESTKRANLAENKLRQFDSWAWKDYESFITWMAWDDAKQLYFFSIEEQAVAKGANAPKDVAIKHGPPLLVELRMAVSASFHVVDHLGGISGLGSMISEPDEGLRSWRIYNPSVLTANYSENGTIGRFNGELGSGKTSGACVQIEQWLKESDTHWVIGNIKMFKPIERYIYVTRASEFLRAVANMPKGAVWIFYMDEGGLNYSKPDQTTKRVRQLDKLMRLIRKFHGSFNLIEQREESVPNLIIEWARNIFRFEKGKAHIVHIELRGPELSFRDTVKSFPKTTLPFDTDDPAMFEFDIDIEALHDAISGEENVMASIVEFLDKKDQESGVAPKPCAMDGCPNVFMEKDKRIKFCPEHRRYFVNGQTRTRDGEKVQYPNMDRFIDGS